MVDVVRDIIEFDPRAKDTAERDETSYHAKPIPYPTGLTPVAVEGTWSAKDPLPKADVIVVTYTTAESYAAADILTPGHDTSTWTRYENGWAGIRKLITGNRAPSLDSKCAGIWKLVTIGSKRVIVFKSNLHPDTDGKNLPIRTLWKQLIEQAQPEAVITTGTAGGVGATEQLGDVVIAGMVAWDCRDQFKDEPFASGRYTTNLTPNSSYTTELDKLMAVNWSEVVASGLTTRNPKWREANVITTDFFAFDDVENTYGLQTFIPGPGAVEMDDAACGLAIQDLGTKAPKWLAVRNASDPQMPKQTTIAGEDKTAAQIYQKYGYWTTINSALVVWAIIAHM